MKRGVLVLALIVGGCASAQPAPISYGASPAARSTPPPQPRSETRSEGRAAIEYRAAGAAQPSAPSAYTPAPAEVAPTQAAAPQQAPDWAEGEGTPLSAYALQPEDVQPYDPARLPRTHRVGPNESLYDIATRYQAPLRALIDQNRLEPPYALEQGRELQLPPPRFHTVDRGETLEDIARRYNVDLRSLALLNRMQRPYSVSRGDRVVLPAMARELPAISEPPAPPPRTQPTVAPSADARFAMPLRGEIVARFGVQPNGVRIDGVEIAGRAGDAVTAAGDGDVVYAGDDLPAYGVLILVRHADNYVTAYGFNRRALVREGQRVRAGQHIAELGDRPDGSARLLFQVRQGGAVVDPAPLLGLAN